MGRVVFLDVDGTLIDQTQMVPLSASQACRRAVEAGHTLVLCTGRSLPEIYPHVWDIGFSGVVSANGAYVRLGERVLRDRRLSGKQVREASAILSSFGALFAWQNPEALYCDGGYLDALVEVGEMMGGQWRRYFDFIVPRTRPGLPESSSKCTFTISASAGHTLDDVREALGPEYSLVAGSLDASVGFTGEIVAAGVSKGSGLACVAQTLGVDLADTVAVGDSANDLPMLEAAGLGIAMGNATDEAKAVAQWVSTPIAEDGLAHALEYAGVA